MERIVKVTWLVNKLYHSFLILMNISFFFPLTDIDYCINHTCANGGSCVDGITNYSCACPAGFTGEHCETGMLFSINQPTNQPVTSQLTNQPINHQSINQSIDRSINRSIDRSINQAIDQSINQLINQSIRHSFRSAAFG